MLYISFLFQCSLLLPLITNVSQHASRHPHFNSGPKYAKNMLQCMRRGWGHEPHLLWNSFDMHKALDQEGSMRKLKKWV